MRMILAIFLISYNMEVHQHSAHVRLDRIRNSLPQTPLPPPNASLPHPPITTPPHGDLLADHPLTTMPPTSTYINTSQTGSSVYILSTSPMRSTFATSFEDLGAGVNMSNLSNIPNTSPMRSTFATSSEDLGAGVNMSNLSHIPNTSPMRSTFATSAFATSEHFIDLRWL